jgi:hypothetical protein
MKHKRYDEGGEVEDNNDYDDEGNIKGAGDYDDERPAQASMPKNIAKPVAKTAPRRASKPAAKVAPKPAPKPAEATTFRGLRAVNKERDRTGFNPSRLYAAGGSVSASKRADGCAQRGKTRGKMI